MLLVQVRQLDAECASENGNGDVVEKQQNRCGNAHGDDDADHQEDSNSQYCDGIPVGHPVTMQAFGQSCQGLPGSRQGKTHRPCSLRRGGADRMSGLPDIRHSRTLPCPRCGAWPVPSPESEGNGAPSGAPSTSALRRARALRKRAPHSALNRGDFCSRGPRFLGRGLAASPSPAGSLRSGRNAARSGPRASRVRACEARPRAPHLPHFRIASRSAPHEQAIGI
jgi:hypothetical protein